MTAPQDDESTDKSRGLRVEVRPQPLSLVTSALSSVLIIVVTLAASRWLLPPLLESSRYSWLRGQLRAEHDSATERLSQVSLDGITQVSELVSQRVTPSVVHIEVEHSSDPNPPLDLTEPFSRRDPSMRSRGQGSGILIDADGLILTNFHVLEGGVTINVRFSDSSREEAELVGIDAARDLALLKVTAKQLPPIAWGDSDAVSVGSPVWAIGSPFGLHGSVTFGILSSKHRVDLSESYYGQSNRIDARYSDLMQSDVAVNPGNSGGPLVNARGELIGVNTAIVGDTFQGVSFSIPSKLAKSLVADILEASKSPRGWLGVSLSDRPPFIDDADAQDVSETPSNNLSNPSAADEIKTRVAKDSAETSNEVSSEKELVAKARGTWILGFANMGKSPARLAGFRIGDCILAVGDEPVASHRDLVELIGSKPPGGVVSILIRRDDSTKRIPVTLGRRFVELRPE